VLQVAETAFREIVGKSGMDLVLYEGREDIASRAEKLMQDILDRYNTGVLVSKVTMQNAQPPEQVQAAFDDAVKAKQDQERARNEGQAYYNDVVPKARGAASRLTEEANGYRQRVVAAAEGEAARFRQVLVEYNKAPGVTRERMYLETVQQIMSNTSKVMIDAKTGGNLLFLPLDKIMQMSAAGVLESNVAKTPQADVPAAEAAGRSRESLRAREREARQQ
jgi:membrane protease subunit HflK